MSTLSRHPPCWVSDDIYWGESMSWFGLFESSVRQTTGSSNNKIGEKVVSEAFTYVNHFTHPCLEVNHDKIHFYMEIMEEESQLMSWSEQLLII